jgi:hypothetical protein
MIRITGAAAAVLLAAAPGWAAAKGTFSYKGLTFTAADGVAFETRAFMGDDPVIRASLTTHALDLPAIESALDYRYAVQAQRSGSQYLDLEFGADGHLAGASYGLGGSTNCGFCGDSAAGAKSQVRVVGDRLKGTLRIQPADYMDREGPAVDLTLDLPILRASGATPLAAGGGEAGRALVACRAAVLKKDAAGARKQCFAEGDERLAQLAETSEEGFWMAGFYDRETLRLPALKVTGGRTKGDWAEVTVEGKDDNGNDRKGSVYLRRGPAGWRFHHEDLGY